MHQEFFTRLSKMTMQNIQREYPNLMAVYFDGEGSNAIETPRKTHPMFYGCFDWHSAVHSHWQLIRLLRVMPTLPDAPAIIDLIDRHFSPENIPIEIDYLKSRPGFERPYGLAWFLMLTAELKDAILGDLSAELKQPFGRWLMNLLEMEEIIADQLLEWLPNLPLPDRTGLHNQTAFAMSLMWDWAMISSQPQVLALIKETGVRFFQEDQRAPIDFEPSASDFLSPALAEADLMRRIWTEDQFSVWLQRFLPQLHENPDQPIFNPVWVADPNDGRLAHAAGLNLSRAWMCEGIAAALPQNDSQRLSLQVTADIHRATGLPYAAREEYMLSHWVPSFAVYLITGRGNP